MDWEFPFVGRKEYFDLLLKRWEDIQCIAVYGLRSIGKSRFVQQLLPIATKHLDDHDYGEAWIDVAGFQYFRQILLNLAEKLQIDIVDDDEELLQAILMTISKTNRNLFIVFDNAEDIIDSDVKQNFLGLIQHVISQSEKVKVILTSTSHLLDIDLAGSDQYEEVELLPLTFEESTELLHAAAPSVKFGEYLKTIVDLCEGLPLALLMTGSELEQDDGMLEPCDMVELLEKCRLKVLSQDLYPMQERIAPMYGQFLNRLSSILKEKLGILSYIPGTFSIEQATRILDDEYEEDTIKKTLMPIAQRHVVQYNSPTQRFNIHGILRDCIGEFIKIQNLPDCTNGDRRPNKPKKQFSVDYLINKCILPAIGNVKDPEDDMTRAKDRLNIVLKCLQDSEELMQEVSMKIDTSQYAEALTMYNLEQQNFHKLMTDVIFSTEDTYPVYIDLVTKAFPTITRFVGIDSFIFIEKVLQLTRSNKKEIDEAFVCVTYGNVLTNLKGNFFEGEKNYMYAIEVMNKYEVPNCLMKVRAHQGLGWNLGSQGKSLDALRTLHKALQYELELGLENDELYTQTLTCLGVFNTFAGFLEEGEKYHLKSLEIRQERYSGNNNPAIGGCYNNMGILYRMKGDHSKSLECYQLGLEIKKKTKATDKAIIMSMNNIAITLSELGRHDEGIEILNEAFEIINKYPGFMFDCRDLSNDTMGIIYLHKKEYKTAIKYLNRGMAGRIESSPTHMCVLEERTKIAQARLGLKDYEKAKNDLIKTVQNKEAFTKQMPQNLFIYECYKMLMEISCVTSDKIALHYYYNLCRAELYRLTEFFEDSGNLQRAKEMGENLKSVQKMYNDYNRGRRG